MKSPKRYQNVWEFYPFYLSQHMNGVNRGLHVTGSTFVLLIVFNALWNLAPARLLFAPLVGYGFAWVGQFVFEKNKPATFTYPLYSFTCDWIMWFQVLSGQLPLSGPKKK